MAVSQAPCQAYARSAEPESTQTAQGLWIRRVSFPARLPSTPTGLLSEPQTPSVRYLPDFASVEWPLPLDTAAVAAFTTAFGLEPRGTWPPLPATVYCVFRFAPPKTSFPALKALLDSMAAYPGVRSVHGFTGY